MAFCARTQDNILRYRETKSMNWSKFFSMGGYALYVWGSYGVTFILLGAEVLMLLKRKRDLARTESSQQFAARSSEL
jgi:heme exporter protein D